MSGAFRITIIFLAIAAIALGAYDIANPYRVGMVGYDNRFLDNGNPVVTRTYSGSPAERVGLRAGDEILRNRRSVREAFQAYFRRAGQSLEIPVKRNGKLLQLHVVTASYQNIKPVEEGPIELIVLAIFALTGMLVALRGVARREVTLLAFFFTLYGAQMAIWWFTDVAVTPALAFVGTVALALVGGLSNYFFLLFVAQFPPIVSGLRATIKRIAFPIVLLAVLFQAWGILADIVPGDQLFQIAGSPAPIWLSNLVWSVIDILFLAIVLEGLARVDDEHRAQMRWVGVAVILSESSWLVINGVLLTNPNQPSWFVWMSLFVDVPLLAIAYAVLRHRLVDISIVVSRAAIFSFVSIFVVALFVALEWAAAQILERTVGSAAANGVPGQALRLVIALGVGLSVRPIHSFVERYLNGVFFAKRSTALAAIRRFANEADVVTNAPSLLTLTEECLRENVEGRYSAIYVRKGAGYERSRSSSETLPRMLDENDSAIVRLRRWSEAFEMDLGSHPLSEALLVPITVRGSLLGVLVCGPKRERTHYLSDEIDALALVAHRVGTAYVLLQQEKHWSASAVLTPA